MKLKLTLLLAAGLALAGYSLNANPLQDAWNAGITNAAVGGGYWRATTGNYSIASYDLVYNFTAANGNLGAGLIAGGDYLWSGKTTHVWNDVKGGFTINYTLAPLQAFGVTNFITRVYGGDCVASPRTAGVGVGNIAFVGMDWSVNLYKQFNFHVDPAFQTRTGQGEFDRSYPGIQGYFSFKF